MEYVDGLANNDTWSQLQLQPLQGDEDLLNIGLDVYCLSYVDDESLMGQEALLFPPHSLPSTISPQIPPSLGALNVVPNVCFNVPNFSIKTAFSLKRLMTTERQRLSGNSACRAVV
ncbi:hypothetical protein ILYODFUR_037436 [Ilyodon furcidens]|uniref:Uncharacterized protein n=1 Tax=Ilyodon furcidens TaxID=33524 RepID=A0ABV0TSP0_9TELE